MKTGRCKCALIFLFDSKSLIVFIAIFGHILMRDSEISQIFVLFIVCALTRLSFHRACCVLSNYLCQNGSNLDSSSFRKKEERKNHRMGKPVLGRSSLPMFQFIYSYFFLSLSHFRNNKLM